MGVAISPGDWNTRFLNGAGGGRKDGNCQARKIGWSQIIEGLKACVKQFGLCSTANGSHQKLYNKE